METLNSADAEMVQQCAALLQTTFKCRVDSERKAAEATLLKLSEQGDQFIKTLIALMTLNESSGNYSIVCVLSHYYYHEIQRI